MPLESRVCIPLLFLISHLAWYVVVHWAQKQLDVIGKILKFFKLDETTVNSCSFLHKGKNLLSVSLFPTIILLRKENAKQKYQFSFDFVKL